MSVRRATLADIPDIAEMSAAFHAYSPWRDVPCEASAVASFAERCVLAGAVFVDGRGMCGGSISELYFNPSFRIAIEFVWWAPHGGRELREAFEVWARAEGAHGVQFSALGDDRLPAVARIYRRAGFRAAETAFIKRFD